MIADPPERSQERRGLRRLRRKAGHCGVAHGGVAERGVGRGKEGLEGKGRRPKEGLEDLVQSLGI